MDRRNLYASDLQIDYFSESYSHFEEDFQRYSNMSVPLTFLIDDILRTMALCRTNYFKLNQENAKDGRNHYFVFKVKHNSIQDVSLSLSKTQTCKLTKFVILTKEGTYKQITINNNP